MNINELKEKFKKSFGGDENDVQIFFAPGRVNLIGEHTDYNGGYVLPCALDYGTYLLIRNSGDNLALATTEFDYSPKIPLDRLHEKHGHQWVNYPLGIFDEFNKLGHSIPSGLQMLYSGTIPHGAGLSSSASIEMVTAIALNEMFSFNHTLLELIQLSQRAENNFVGMNCGIMDQFSVGMGKENHAVFLNTETLKYELVPVQVEGYKLIIANTNKPRKLTDSKYNERRRECEQALKQLNQESNEFNNLTSIGYERFLTIQHRISNPLLLKRARHVISENKRVIDAAWALKNGDIKGFGRLMNESHDSLRQDYEVTGKELDILVEEARKIKGVLGSRMTGAGFGGCTVSLVKSDVTEEFMYDVGNKYKSQTGIRPDFYITNIQDGVKKINH
jgi:galactokinase